MRKYRIIFIAAFSLISLFSCNQQEHFKISEEFVDYFGNAKDGSWWSFINSSDSTIDSIYLSDYSVTREFSNASHQGDSYMKIQYNLISSTVNNRASVGIDRYQTNYFNFMPISGDSPDFFNTFPITYYQNENFSLQDACSSCGIKLLDSYQLNSFEFNDVLKVWRLRDSFYFAPKVGLIKYTLDGVDYNLTDYSIIN